MKVKSLKLHDEQYGNQWFDEVEDRWNYDDFLKNDAWRKGWISFDCSLYGETDDRVYLGVTSFDADIFKAYDRRQGRFIDLGYANIADPFDAKFHRSLEMDDDGSIYAAIALLHDVDDYFNAPGGAIIKYHPKTGDLTKLGIPKPRAYIQSIALDSKRRLVHCLQFAPETLTTFNLVTGEVVDLGMIGTGYGGMAQGENVVLDDDGRLWCNWSLTRAWQSDPGVDAVRICRYDPDAADMTFFKTGLPMPDGSHGFAKPEAYFNFHDGFIHASGANGALYRIDAETGKAELRCQPVTDRRSRLAALTLGEDGAAYGVVGRDGQCEFARFDLKSGECEKLGPMEDEDGAKLWQCHHVCVAKDGTFYVCENDNPYRSGYLWEVSL